VPPRPTDGDAIDIDLSFTPHALNTLLDTVGSRPPESGAKLFGPVGGFGVDLVEFDVRGSQRAGGAVYAPDTEWGSSRLAHWISQDGDDQRIWTGDAHSHPGGFGWPSRRSGPGLGDLGYVEAVFEQNEIQFEFAIPILTATGPGTAAVRIHPWVVLRSEPLRPRWARFSVRAADAFPERLFNPAFEAGADAAAGTGPAWPRLDLDRLARLLKERFGHYVVILGPDEHGSVEIDVGDAIVRIELDGSGSAVTATILEGSGSGIQAGSASGRADPDREGTAATLAGIALEAGRSRRPADAPLSSTTTLEGTGSDSDDADGEESVGAGADPDASPSPITREEYYARVTSVLSEDFHDRSILVVGASGGSYLIEKLARLGPRRIVIVDPDVVEVPNLVRTAFRIDQVGMAKTVAMADLVATANPFVEVDARPDDITTLGRDEVHELLDGIDVIIAGTDSFEAQATLNRWSQLSGIPAVFIGVHEGASGGIVRCSVPGTTACYRCGASTRYDAAASDGHVDLPEEPGLLIDVQVIDMVAASVIVGLLERGASTPKGRLIEQLGDRTQIVVATSPAYEWGQALFGSLTSDLPAPTSREADLATYLGALPIVTLPTPPDPACPDCRLFNPPADRDADPDPDPTPDETTRQEGR